MYPCVLISDFQQPPVSHHLWIATSLALTRPQAFPIVAPVLWKGPPEEVRGALGDFQEALQGLLVWQGVLRGSEWKASF